MTKINEKELANRFGWDLGETKEALNEFLAQESVLNLKEILTVFHKAHSSQERLFNTTEYLFKKYKLTLVETIIRLLFNPGPSFCALALFNYYDTRDNDDQENDEYSISWELTNKSFLTWESHSGLLSPLRKYSTLKFDPKYVPDELQDEVLDMLVNKTHQEKVINREDLFLLIAREAGYLAFNIRAFRMLGSDYRYDPSKTNSANELLNSLSVPLEYITSTNRKHWLYYVMSKILQESKGCKTRESFDYISLLLDESAKTVSARYYEKEKLAKKNGWTVLKITSLYKLDKIVEDHLKEFDESKDELKHKRTLHLKKMRESKIMRKR